MLCIVILISKLMHPRPKIKKIMGAVPLDWCKVFCQDGKKVCVLTCEV
jgi:hypothetical protein